MSVISTEEFKNKYSHVDFQKLSRIESCPRVRERLLGLYNLMLGKNRIEAAKAVGRNPEWLRSWILRYDDGGYENLIDKPRPGKPKFLTNIQEKHLIIDILLLQEQRNGGRLTAREIIEFVSNKYKVNYKMNGMYDLLERIGMSWVSSRSRHPNSDPLKQKSFMRTFKARAAKIKLKKKENRNLVSR